MFRYWQAHGCFDLIFTDSVAALHAANLLDTGVIHGGGTTTAAKKGGDKVVAFCDRNCNVIAPFVSAPGNRNESPLLRDALPQVMRIARAVGFSLHGSVVSLDGVYDCRVNRTAIFNRGMTPNINPNTARQENHPTRPQTVVRSRHLRRALSHHRARVRLGR